MMPTLNRRQWTIICGFVVIGLLLALLRVLAYQHNLDRPLNLREAYILEVEAGSNLIRVLNKLESAKVVHSALDLRIFARLALGSPGLFAGEYILNPGLSGRGLLEKLVNGEVSYHQVQILEGWTLRQALAAIQAHPEIVRQVQDPAELQALLGTQLYPEGMIFPDTYNFSRGTTDIELVRQAYTQMQKVLNEVWELRDAGLPYATAYEALIMASIIEKETALASERNRIAGVFVRRLQLNMRLQTDPSVIYGMGEFFNGNLTRLGLQADTPWNTYTRAGLPLTPIALPGRAAIMASVHPDDSDALFFVAKGDGSHYFSATLAEHNAAVQQYQLSGNQGN